MNIGIVTLWGSRDNYGQVLQNFALQTYLRILGHDVTTIRYQEQSPDTSNKKTSVIWRIWNRILRYTPEGRKKYKEALLWVDNSIRSGERQFDEFRDRHLKYTDVLSDYHSLVQLPFDAFIVGSDQVWNIDFDSSIADFRFLKFASSKKVSYAASVGKPTLTERELRLLEERTKGFNSISIRERDTADFINKHSNVKAEWVLDPTFLLSADEYADILSLKKTKTNDLFVYALNIDCAEDIYLGELERFCGSNNLDLRLCCSTGYKPYKELSASTCIEQLTINQWLEAIMNAKTVVTTSFHGIAFCLIFKKSFIYIPLGDIHSMANNRVISLLQYLGLSDRIVTSVGALEVLLMSRLAIDDCICNRLENMISTSKKFLNKSV